MAVSITNTSSVINITNTDIDYGSNTLIKVSKNEKYGDTEDNGGEVNFTATDQRLKGNIVVDYIYNDATEQNEYGFVAVNK